MNHIMNKLVKLLIIVKDLPHFKVTGIQALKK